MDKKCKKKLKLRIFSIILSLTLVCGIGVISLKDTSNNVNAYTTSFIEQSDFTIGLGSILILDTTYDYEKPYIVRSTFGDSFLSFNVNTNEDWTITFTSRTTNDSASNSTTFNGYFYTANFSKTTNSQRIQFNSIGSLRTLGFNFFPDSNNNDIFTSLKPYGGSIMSCQINIPIKYKDINLLYSNCNVSRYLLYRVDNSTYKINIVYANSLATLDTDPVMSVYFTFDGEDLPDYFNSKYLYSDDILKIDRTPYIEKEYIYVEVPTYELSVFDSIVNGISSFMDIEILPEFNLGHIFLIILGFSFMSMLFHLLVK